MRLTNDWHHAEDILVETFTKLARSALDDRGTIKAWLYRVATNQCYKLFRRNKTIELKEDFPDNCKSDALLDKQRELKIRTMLTKLSNNHRAVVVMRFFNDMSYQEIADVLCIPLGTVKSRMHEALKQLKALSKNDWRHNEL